jgi:methyl-accepting chemotaxis protein
LKKIIYSIGFKLSVIVIAILLILSLVISYVVMKQIKEGIKIVAIEKAKSELILGNKQIDLMYPGDWEIREGSLFKGSVRMNENFEVTDSIGRDTGGTVTIFQGNTRVATNVMRDGQRAVGTTVSPEVEDVVLKKGELFVGEADVVGIQTVTAYQPIKNIAGEIIGIWYVGVSQEMVKTIQRDFNQKFLIVLILSIITSFIIIGWYAGLMQKRMRRISVAMQKAGEGNFSLHLTDRSHDEIGQLTQGYNAMKENLTKLVEVVLQTSEKVTTYSEELNFSAEQTSKASEHIAKAIQQVSTDADKQMIGVIETTRALIEVSDGIQKMAENSSSISEFALMAKQKADKGGLSIGSTLRQMKTVDQSVSEMDQIIHVLENKSSRIGEITEMIQGVAATTNLLGLNASIEAARAGEHGNGFAVVAMEIRKLAAQSEKSSEQIFQLIEEIINDVANSNTAMQQVKMEVNSGLNAATDAEQQFKEIIMANNQIVAQIHDIAAISQQISAGAEEITATMNEIGEISKRNADHSQNVAASSEQQLATMQEISSSASFLTQTAEELQVQIKSLIV